MSRHLSSVPAPARGAHDAPEEAVPVASSGAPLAVIVRDGWVTALTVDGTYTYTQERWVFAPLLHPHLRLPVVDPEMTCRLYAAVAASGVLGPLLQTVADAR